MCAPYFGPLVLHDYKSQGHFRQIRHLSQWPTPLFTFLLFSGLGREEPCYLAQVRFVPAISVLSSGDPQRTLYLSAQV